MSAAACGKTWLTPTRGRRGAALVGLAAWAGTTGDDDLVTRLPLPLNRTGRTADGAGVAPTIWEDLEYAGEADALAFTLRGLARLEDEVLSV